MDRLVRILEELPTCNVFADIGCDHGYITKGMLDCGKCKTAIISDISQKCLNKAEILLSDYIKQGKVKSFVSDGFENLPDSDLALIAGMGGEEIISILKNRENLPPYLMLQPMKNVDKLRVYLIERGYKIIKDFTFRAEKQFYDLIFVSIGTDFLTEEEIEFGRTNLIEKSEDFRDKIKREIDKIEECLTKNLSLKDREYFINKKEKLLKYV